eukprot:6262521-Amphidinium_carterae.1
MSEFGQEAMLQPLCHWAWRIPVMAILVIGTLENSSHTPDTFSKNKIPENANPGIPSAPKRRQNNKKQSKK